MYAKDVNKPNIIKIAAARAAAQGRFRVSELMPNNLQWIVTSRATNVSRKFDTGSRTLARRTNATGNPADHPARFPTDATNLNLQVRELL